MNNYTMYSVGGAIHMLGFGNSIFLENATIADTEAVPGDTGRVYVAKLKNLSSTNAQYKYFCGFSLVCLH
ncbi:MAG: hypothetical protein U9N85_02920 [Bacteroidota bacterium]|nr:hypothetical protein [Bacteroidota bacterium]